MKELKELSNGLLFSKMTNDELKNKLDIILTKEVVSQLNESDNYEQATNFLSRFVEFVLRKKGAETSELFDFLLNEKGLNFTNKQGYVSAKFKKLLTDLDIMEVLIKKYPSPIKFEIGGINNVASIFNDVNVNEEKREKILSTINTHFPDFLNDSATYLIGNVINRNISKAIPWILNNEILKNDLTHDNIASLYLLSLFCNGTNHNDTKLIESLPTFEYSINKTFQIKNHDENILYFFLHNFDTRSSDIDIFKDKKESFNNVVKKLILNNNSEGIFDSKFRMPGFYLMQENVIDANSKLDFLLSSNLKVLCSIPEYKSHCVELANDYSKIKTVFDNDPNIFFERPASEKSNSSICTNILNLIKLDFETKSKSKKLNPECKELFDLLLSSEYPIDFGEKLIGTNKTLLEIVGYKKELLSLIYEKRPEVFDKNPVFIHTPIMLEDWKMLANLKKRNYTPNTLDSQDYTPLSLAFMKFLSCEEKNKLKWHNEINSLLKDGEDPLFETTTRVNPLTLLVDGYFQKQRKEAININSVMKTTKVLLDDIVIDLKNENKKIPTIVYSFYLNYLMNVPEPDMEDLYEKIITTEEDKKGMILSFLDITEFMRNHIIMEKSKSYFSNVFVENKNLKDTSLFNNILDKNKEVLFDNSYDIVKVMEKNANIHVGMKFLDNFVDEIIVKTKINLEVNLLNDTITVNSHKIERKRL